TRNKVRDHFRRLRDEPRADGGSDARRRLLEVPDPLADDDPSEADLVRRQLRRGLDGLRDEVEPPTRPAVLPGQMGGPAPGAGDGGGAGGPGPAGGGGAKGQAPRPPRAPGGAGRPARRSRAAGRAGVLASGGPRAARRARKNPGTDHERVYLSRPGAAASLRA